ncbi:hypothetical protein J437_LFUL016508 [Ladona fulva]|uniref:Uncharacterized protein n=1 Tax=Ladona fulva TaxID=123851 RepID=A0A8K0P870_LADFU|nr:hypothetical protein J437_LFUL016508 [Ladona fulva]
MTPRTTKLLDLQVGSQKQTQISALLLPVTQKVTNHFPHCQHRPSKITIGMQVPLFITSKQPNIKANREKFWQEVGVNVQHIPLSLENYRKFSAVLFNAAKNATPHGYRKNYTPCWSNNLEELCNQYNETDDQELVHKILSLLDKGRAEKWKETVANVDFTHSIHKIWFLLRILGSAVSPPVCLYIDTPNEYLIDFSV